MSPVNPDHSPSKDVLPRLVIPLFKGVVHRRDDEVLWQSLVDIQARVRDYVSVLNLQLVIDESEGFAFLRTRPQADEPSEDRLPQLIARHPLSYPVSLLLALLRKRLVEFDAAGGDPRLVMTRDEVLEMVRVFLPDTSNEVNLKRRLNENLNRIVKLGFLRRLSSSAPGVQHRYEVQRIIKEFVNAEWLAEFGNKLAESVSVLEEQERSKDD